MKNKFLLVFSMFCLLCSTQTLLAQVTTASMSGTVTDKKTKEAIPGVTIIAVHTPTGGQFGVVTDDNGTFSINNMKVGGPYKVTFSFIGYKQQDIMLGSLGLGENTKLNAALIEEGSLDITEEAVVTARRDATFDAGRTGATTNINSEQLAALPTLSRGLQDFVRLTPQFSAQDNGGISFGGANNRFNSIMIDGAVNNDVFGLNASGTPGGRTNAQPVSLDAVKEIQVLIAPYDVRQSGFVGGGVNAITRSGTNELEGSAYYFTRSDRFTGDKVGDAPLTVRNFRDTQFGFRFGGPIVKNKLFYFFNAELGRRDDPNPNNIRNYAENVRRQKNGTEADRDLLETTFTNELLNMRRILINKYNYDPGDPTENYLNTQNNNKIFARLDWNINNQHTLTLRHNFIDAFVKDIFRSGNQFSFGNSGSIIKNRTNTTVLELQSRFSNKISNEFRVSFTNINDFRENEGRDFPQMSVISKTMKTAFDADVFIGAGLDAIGGLNSLNQNLIEITDNLTIKKGKHTFVFGTRNELYFFENKFTQNFAGSWRFASLQKPTEVGAIDFSLESGTPDRFLKTYSRTADPKQGVNWGAIQLGVYAQDDWNIAKNLRLTIGVRADLPYMSSSVTRNDLFVKQFGLDNSAKPTAKPLISPRIGFNWDVKSDGKTQVRGGVGLFAGRPPFVWLSNQYSNNGIGFGQIALDANLGNQADINALFAGTTPAQRDAILSDPNYVPQTQTATSVINLTNPNLRLPQVFRANLGVDRKLPFGLVGTFEALYSKTINDMYVRNINLRGQQNVLNNEGRPIFGIPGTGAGVGPRLVDPANFTGVYVLENARGGDQLSLTAKLERNRKGLYTMLAYTYSEATDFASLTSSVASSNFNNNITSGNPNAPVQATTDFNLRHRIVGALSYNAEYSKYASTNVALFYNGQSGRNFSYIIGNAGASSRDINADGITGNELMYIPRTREDIELQNTTLASTATVDNGVDIRNFGILDVNGKLIEKAAPYTVSTDLQWNALDNFISNETSLKDRRGQFAERNGAVAPWNHRFDLRLMQNIRYNSGADDKKHTLQFTLDIINVGNLLNKNWGVIPTSITNPVTAQSYNTVTGNIVYTIPVAVTATSLVTDAVGAPILVGGRPQVKTATAEIIRNRDIITLSSVWQMQFGVRYLF